MNGDGFVSRKRIVNGVDGCETIVWRSEEASFYDVRSKHLRQFVYGYCCGGKNNKRRRIIPEGVVEFHTVCRKGEDMNQYEISLIGDGGEVIGKNFH